MVIGIVAENREESEKRVILPPEFVTNLVNKNIIKVECGAGRGLNFSDSDYRKYGARIVSREEVYRSDIVMRIRFINSEEMSMMKRGSILVSFFHRDTHWEAIGELRKKGITLLEMNEIRDKNQDRLVEAFGISGTYGVRNGFGLYKKIYKKDPKIVVVMGYGHLAMPAIQAACKLGALVKVLGRHQTRRKVLKEYLKDADVLINATYRKPFEIGKYLVKKEDLLIMNTKSLVLDLSADPVSCIETAHPTTLDNQYYFAKVNSRSIPHMCVYSLPAYKPYECSTRYAKQILPYVISVASMGAKKASKEIPELRNAFVFPS